MNPIQDTNSNHNFDFSLQSKENLKILSELEEGEKIAFDEKNNKIYVSGKAASKNLSYIPGNKFFLSYIIVPLIRGNNGDSINKTVQILLNFVTKINEESKCLNFINPIDQNEIYELIKKDSEIYEKCKSVLKNGLKNLCKTYDKKKLDQKDELILGCKKVKNALQKFYHQKYNLLNSKLDRFSDEKTYYRDFQHFLIDKPWYMQEVKSLYRPQEDVKYAIVNLKFENEVIHQRNKKLCEDLQQKEPRVTQMFSNMDVEKKIINFDMFSQSLEISNRNNKLCMSFIDKLDQLNENQNEEIFYEEKISANGEVENDIEVSEDLDYVNTYNLFQSLDVNERLRYENKKLRLKKAFEFSNMFEDAMYVFATRSQNK